MKRYFIILFASLAALLPAAAQRLTVGGYGEVAMSRNFYSDNVYRYSSAASHAGEQHGRFDIPHAVIYVGYDFGKGWSMQTEIEFEHTGTGTASEKEFEEALQAAQEEINPAAIVLDEIIVRPRKTDIVVDNPPFSIISKIISFYADNGIKFFLFAPSLTGFSTAQIEKSTTIATGATITYENGAKVSTSFVTNLEGDYIVRTDPVLLKDVEEMDAKIRKEKRVELPKYEYPSYIVTMAMMCTWAKYGIWFKVPRGQGVQIQALDAQKEEGKGIFGGGILLSEKARIEAEKARKPQVYELSEREQTIVWELSDREQTIVWELSDRES